MTNAYNSLGVSQRHIGLIQEAVSSYFEALKFEPKKFSSLDNLSVLLLQMGSAFACKNEELTKIEKGLEGKTSLIYTCTKLINKFRHGEFLDAKKIQLELDKRLQKSTSQALSARNKQFCHSYNSYIKLLLKHKWPSINSLGFPALYHIGESHCLSFAHQKVMIKGLRYIIKPKLIIGTKAWSI